MKPDVGAVPTPTAAPASGSRTDGVLRARRSPRLVAAGVLCACLGALGGAVAWQQASTASPVIVVNRAVPRGETVRSQDLGVVELGSAPGVNTVPADRMSQLVGKKALVDLPSGSLVGQDSVGEPKLASGTAEVGLKLAAGKLPTSSMPAGTSVELVEVPADGASATKTTPRSFAGQVVTSPRQLADGGTWVVDVAIDQTNAVEVAQLSAHDRIVLIKKAGR